MKTLDPDFLVSALGFCPPVLSVMPLPGLASSGSRLPRERLGSVLSQDWFCDLELISGSFRTKLSHSVVKEFRE